MIQAILKSRDGMLSMDLPRNTYDFFEKLRSIGIQESPNAIYLNGQKDDSVKLRLIADEEVGRHLIQAMQKGDSLADANMAIFMAENAGADIRDKLRKKILSDQYHSCQDIRDDIRTMTYNAGPIKEVFYCPLTGNIDEGDEDYFTAGNSYLRDYKWAIEELIQKEEQHDSHDMAEYFDEDENIARKLASVKWGVEPYRGRLFGRIECSLKEPLTEKEEEVMKEWITGQNSDGWGEHFEQQPIETEDGYLFVSFWHGGNDYAVMTHDELDEYIENQEIAMGFEM